VTSETAAAPIYDKSRLGRRLRVALLALAGAGPGMIVGLVIVGTLLVASIAAPLLPLSDPLGVDYGARLLPPSFAHPLGTDNLGRDMLSRVVYGARIDLTLGFVTVACSMAIGIPLGMLAGFRRGVLEPVIMRTVDAFLAFPFLVLVLAVVAIVGPGLLGIYIGMIVVSWTVYARITFSEMVVLREAEFILAARTLGFSDARILLRHALPNILRANLSFAISDIVYNILALASLSYIGVGVQPPSPEWGSLIATGRDQLLSAWWISTLPGIAVVITGIGFALVGEGLAERLNARRRSAA
jgi:peptide/nickel transport system permease protein